MPGRHVRPGVPLIVGLAIELPGDGHCTIIDLTKE